MMRQNDRKTEWRLSIEECGSKEILATAAAEPSEPTTVPVVMVSVNDAPAERAVPGRSKHELFAQRRSFLAVAQSPRLSYIGGATGGVPSGADRLRRRPLQQFYTAEHAARLNKYPLTKADHRREESTRAA